jgi:phosphatidylglycerol:prolipoprotein diacylglycerol transferase
VHPFLDLGRVTIPGLGPVELSIPVYGLFVATALLTAWIWTARRAGRAGLDQERVGRVILWTVLAGIAGGKLGLVLLDLPRALSDPGGVFTWDLLQAAGVVWTALLGGLAGLVVGARRNAVDLPRMLDAAALPLPVAQAIGRIGCLFAGCCFGSHCTLPWGIVYRSSEASARTGVPLGETLHPAPLYEAGWSLLVVLPVLAFVERRRRRAPGELAALYLALYGLGRFGVEFFRGDRVRGLWLDGLLSTSQLLSLAVLPVALAAWWHLRRQSAPDREGAR